jgi:DNA-damage-inducible protein J
MCFLLPFAIQCITKQAKQELKMKTEMLATRIDHDTKLAFTHICDEVGLSPSQAIKLFARAVINYGGIPFELKAKQPNSMTITAIQELSQGLGQKSESVSHLISELTEGKVTNVNS